MQRKLGARIASLRKSMGYTQLQLAKIGGMSLRHVQDVEAGKSDVKLSMVDRFARALELDVGQLLGSLEEQPELLDDGQTGRFSAAAFESYAHLDLLPVGLLIFDVQGLLWYINAAAAKMLDCCVNEVMGHKHLWDFVADSESKETLKKYLHFWTSEQPKPSPYCWNVSRKSNGFRRIRLDWSYIYDGSGKVVAYFSGLHSCDDQNSG